MQEMIGRDDRLPHTLMPIGLALASIGHAVYGDLNAPPPESIANFVAGTIPIFEYFPDKPAAARLIRRRDLNGGVFRQNGTELHFLDKRPARVTLAVNADDVRCVIEMLKAPREAMHILHRRTKLRSQELRTRSADLAHRAFELRRRSSKIANGDI